MRNLAAKSAAHARLNNFRYRFPPQRVWIWRDRQRWATRKADAGMIARTGVVINAEPFPHGAQTCIQPPLQKRTLATLFVQHALRARDDHFGTCGFSLQRFLQRIAHPRHIVSIADGAGPAHPDAPHRALDRVSRCLLYTSPSP